MVSRIVELREVSLHGLTVAQTRNVLVVCFFFLETSSRSFPCCFSSDSPSHLFGVCQPSRGCSGLQDVHESQDTCPTWSLCGGSQGAIRLECQATCVGATPKALGSQTQHIPLKTETCYNHPPTIPPRPSRFWGRQHKGTHRDQDSHLPQRTHTYTFFRMHYAETQK